MVTITVYEVSYLEVTVALCLFVLFFILTMKDAKTFRLPMVGFLLYLLAQVIPMISSQYLDSAFHRIIASLSLMRTLALGIFAYSVYRSSFLKFETSERSS